MLCISALSLIASKYFIMTINHNVFIYSPIVGIFVFPFYAIKNSGTKNIFPDIFIAPGHLLSGNLAAIH